MSVRVAPPSLPEPLSAQAFADATGVSRETFARLKAYVGLLEDWNARHNLVSRDSLSDVWRRHVWDSAQLSGLVPLNAKRLVDLGSGAGFPGLVLAELLRDRMRVTLIESTGKKCAFLRAVADRLALSLEIRNARIEEARPETFDVITARACAPLPKLLSYAHKFVGKGTVCLLPKGRSLEAELTDAHKSWTMAIRQHPSATDPSGVILEIRELARARAG